MTCTIVGWLPVFSRPPVVNIILDSWRFLQREREFSLFGYVIMENHIHLIAHAPDLPKAMKDFKSFTAREIVDRFESAHEVGVLGQLQWLKLAHKTQSDYQVWQEGNHPVEISGDPMMLQKLEYMHNNPVKRGYVDDPVHWRYSSARNYAGQTGLIEVVTDWR
jgi:REP element-mobilizing transposase RayT